MKNMTYRDAIKEAVREEMLRDPDVFIMGEDVGVFGNVFKVFWGLYDEFGPERVRSTPLSEMAI
ncbi:MAG: alpha-ketoacid dehydrogenase subunit beta, partial [bacterium]